MSRNPELPDHAGSPARVLELLRQRLETAEELTLLARDGLLRGDAVAIEQASSRLATVALESKLLLEEFRRLPTDVQPEQRAELEQARRAFGETATRLARSAAVGGGLLARLVSMSNQLLATWNQAGSGTYLRSGRSRELPAEGHTLRGTV